MLSSHIWLAVKFFHPSPFLSLQLSIFVFHTFLTHSLPFNPHSPQEVASPCPPSLLLLSFTSGQAAVAGQGSVGWEGVEGRRGEGGGCWWWLSFEEAINCKAQGTVKEKKWTQNVHCEKNMFWNKSLQFFSVYLSHCLPVHYYTLLKRAAVQGEGGWGEAWGLRRSRGRRGRMVRAKISISDFHILNTLIYLTPGLF